MAINLSCTCKDEARLSLTIVNNSIIIECGDCGELKKYGRIDDAPEVQDEE